MNVEFTQERWRRDPKQLPTLSGDAQLARVGDRRPGVRFCARCAGTLEGAPVLKGMWAYCSIECALKIETEP